VRFGDLFAEMHGKGEGAKEKSKSRVDGDES